MGATPKGAHEVNLTPRERFCYNVYLMRNRGTQALNLEKYKSPTNESSLFKGIPISERQNPVIRELMKTRLFSVKYRGVSKPNYSRPQSYINKEFADTFAIYPYSGYPEYRDLVNDYSEDYDWPEYYDKAHESIARTAKGIISDNK